MINRNHVEQFLRLNGLSSDAPETEIRSLLLSARWHQDDVETALVVLREDPNTHVQQVDSMHRVFTSDDKINPETLSALLGVDVQVNSVSAQHQDMMRRHYHTQLISIGILSFFGALVFLVGAMWFLKVGFFHEYGLEF